MLAALVSCFALSQAYRTVPGVTAGAIAAEFSLSQQQVTQFAAAFHLAFAVMQIGVGISLDRYGAKRTACWLFSLTVLGALLSALAPTYAVLVLGQALIGFGCAPALLACLVFIGRHVGANRLSAVSGLVMSVGGIGTLMTATPLAWLVELWSWRAGFLVLAALSALAVLACGLLVERDPERGADATESLGASFRMLFAVITMRQAPAILILGGITYAVVMAIRSLWLVPLFTERYDFSLVSAGNVVLIMSVAMMLGPALFGRLDPGPRLRRRVIFACTLLLAALIAALGLCPAASPVAAIAIAVTMALQGGFTILQYADTRTAYPPQSQGRALSALTMSMFAGVAIVQWLSGLAAALASNHGADPVTAAYLSLAAIAVAGAAAFALLPGPRRQEHAPAP
ncbi:MFS transporter [Chelatococcus reniformis]|nr:MFS transporter [Chelatococcus reniformis]